MIDIPRGNYNDKRVGGPPKDEVEHFMRFLACGGWVDCRDLRQVFEHDGPRPAFKRRPAAGTECPVCHIATYFGCRSTFALVDGIFG